MSRDFTYIDDVIDYTYKIIRKRPKKKIKNSVPFETYNIGNKKPIKLLSFIKILEKNLNKKAKIEYLNFQKTEIKNTSSDTTKLYKTLKFKKYTSINIGIKILFIGLKIIINFKI